VVIALALAAIRSFLSRTSRHGLDVTRRRRDGSRRRADQAAFDVYDLITHDLGLPPPIATAWCDGKGRVVETAKSPISLQAEQPTPETDARTPGWRVLRDLLAEEEAAAAKLWHHGAGSTIKRKSHSFVESWSMISRRRTACSAIVRPQAAIEQDVFRAVDASVFRSAMARA